MAMSSSHSATEAAMGFSTITCLPASSARCAIGKCSGTAVAITIACRSGSARRRA